MAARQFAVTFQRAATVAEFGGKGADLKTILPIFSTFTALTLYSGIPDRDHRQLGSGHWLRLPEVEADEHNTERPGR